MRKKTCAFTITMLATITTTTNLANHLTRRTAPTDRYIPIIAMASASH